MLLTKMRPLCNGINRPISDKSVDLPPPLERIMRQAQGHRDRPPQRQDIQALRQPDNAQNRAHRDNPSRIAASEFKLRLVVAARPKPRMEN